MRGAARQGERRAPLFRSPLTRLSVMSAFVVAQSFMFSEREVTSGAQAAPVGVELSASKEVGVAQGVALELPLSPLDHVLARSLELYPEARLSTWSDEGHLDWSELSLTVTGVGTPLLLSPTGGLATQELGEVALKDAEARLYRGVKRIITHLSSERGEGRTQKLGCSLKVAVSNALEQGRPQRFSDGSVHHKGALSLRSVACPQARTQGGSALSFARLKGSPIQRLSQLPVIIDARGAPISLSALRFFVDFEPARSMMIGALKASPRTLSRAARPGEFTLQGSPLAEGEELWVFISSRDERQAEPRP